MVNSSDHQRDNSLYTIGVIVTLSLPKGYCKHNTLKTTALFLAIPYKCY